MAGVRRTNHRAGMKVRDLLREPLEAAQARLGTVEKEAQKLLRDVSARVQKEWKQDWPELRERLDKLVAASRERAQDWRGRAENFRADAMERLVELQARAMKFLGVATQEQVQELSREVDRILKRLQKPRRKGRKPAKPSEPEVQAQA